MRGLGISLMLLGVLGILVIFLFPAVLNYSGLFGCVAAILTGVGFFARC